MNTDAYTARAKREAAAIIADNEWAAAVRISDPYAWALALVAQAWLEGYRAALESLTEQVRQ